MIIKKLAVPLINEKLLHQALHCYIATSGISEQGFDFIITRLSPSCRVEIVTGLQIPTEPKVLRRILKQFTDRVRLKIFSKNFFQPNVYIFDLPYRKAVAFLGSGNLTLGGLKDYEEIFCKISDAKEIEALKSWFTGYYEFCEPLSDKLINEFEWVFPSMKQREIASSEEVREVLGLTTGAFDWESIRFKTQYFQKDDFLIFSNEKASLNTPEIIAARMIVQQKLLNLHTSIKQHLSVLKLYEGSERGTMVSSMDTADHQDKKVRSMWIAYGRSQQELALYSANACVQDFMSMVITIRQKEVGLWLIPGNENAGWKDRDHFYRMMHEPEYRKTFFQLLQRLNLDENNKENARKPYWIQIAGEKRPVHSFPDENALLDFTRYDDWKLYRFIIGRNYSPGDPEINSENISVTIEGEFGKLNLVYRHLLHQK
ncbi:MAG: hypothetical protein ABIR06_14485 [Cyclobacteriaceae bacterium]